MFFLALDTAIVNLFTPRTSKKLFFGLLADLATFDEQIFLCPKWTLYKILKYQIKLMEFRQDHFKFKMVQSNSQDGLMLQKANDDFCNVISHLRFLNSASK